MREINHENVNAFLGACVDPPNVCFVTRYCTKGSLEDIIHNDDFKLDLNFRNSFIFDIIHVRTYNWIVLTLHDMFSDFKSKALV